MTMLNRIKQLEMASRPMGGMHWITPTRPGQSRAEARAAYEATNGLIGENDIELSWDVFPKELPSSA